MENRGKVVGTNLHLRQFSDSHIASIVPKRQEIQWGNSCFRQPFVDNLGRISSLGRSSSSLSARRPCQKSNRSHFPFSFSNPTLSASGKEFGHPQVAEPLFSTSFKTLGQAPLKIRNYQQILRGGQQSYHL